MEKPQSMQISKLPSDAYWGDDESTSDQICLLFHGRLPRQIGRSSELIRT